METDITFSKHLYRIKHCPSTPENVFIVLKSAFQLRCCIPANVMPHTPMCSNKNNTACTFISGCTFHIDISFRQHTETLGTTIQHISQLRATQLYNWSSPICGSNYIPHHVQSTLFAGKKHDHSQEPRMTQCNRL